MAAWFECKVTYEKVADNGMPKKVVESYLVDADSFTLAEAKMIEEITPFVSMGEFNISNIRKVNYAELFLNEDDKCDRYYRCKVLYVTIDEKNGVEKKRRRSCSSSRTACPMRWPNWKSRWARDWPTMR